jgi:hypothetical protein
VSDDYVVAVEGLESLRDLQNLDAAILRRARLAINATVERSQVSAAKEMRSQVDFPARYLTGANGRLSISKYASETSLSASITGRDRPTSLARFATETDPAKTRQQGGVNVTVQPGKTVFMKGAFLMRLASGNLGLAIRLKAGETLRNKKKMLRVGKGLYLLYGPSVDQVFRSVAVGEAQNAAEYLEAEFLRLMDAEI